MNSKKQVDGCEKRCLYFEITLVWVSLVVLLLVTVVAIAATHGAIN